MLISGGKVLAMTEVLSDNTLTGDGVFKPLGVVGFIREADAVKRFQPIGDYVKTGTLTSLYYTKDYINTNFAPTATTYTRADVDYKFATKDDCEELSADFTLAINNFSGFINGNYYTKTQVDKLIEDASTTEYVDAQIASLSASTTALVASTANYLRGNIGDVNDSLTAHIASTAHISYDERRVIAKVSGIDFDTFFVKPTGLEAFSAYSLQSDLLGNLSWVKTPTVTAGNGLSGAFDANNRYTIALPTSSTDAISKVENLTTVTFVEDEPAIKSDKTVYFKIEEVGE